MNSSCPFGIISLVWMKTHLIVITPTYSIESHTSDCVMESSFVDSILKLVCINLKPKKSKSTSTDPWMEPFVEYSKPELFLLDSKLEFVNKPKFPTVLSGRCLLVEFQLFGWFLPNSMDHILGFRCQQSNFFGLIMFFNVV
jgi:hypothetical protein